MHDEEPTIILKRGELLQLRVAARNNGMLLPIDPSWQTSCFAQPVSGRGKIDLGATIEDGKVAIDYDTAALAETGYRLDVRFSQSAGDDAFTATINLRLDHPVTPPSAR